MNMNKKYRLLLLVAALLLALGLRGQVPQVASGRIVRVEAFSSQHVPARTLDIWLPDTYNGNTRHDVLYMHDGQMLFDSAITWNRQEWGVDETASALIAAGRVRPFIVVGIWNGGQQRHCEFFPQRPFETLPPQVADSLYQLKRPNGNTVFHCRIYSDRYLRFMVEELKPYIDSVFVTHRSPAHTFVAGSSMGGLISWYARCEYPQVFGGAACLSTHWPGVFSNENNPIPAAFFSYLRQHLPPPAKRSLYMDCGNATLDALYPVHQQVVNGILRDRGYRKRHAMSRFYPGEDHSESAWRARFEQPLLFLMGQ
jgi:enterochelin esterase-like enzyme